VRHDGDTYALDWRADPHLLAILACAARGVLEARFSCDLPGMDPGTIDLTVEQNVLTIKSERRFERREGDEVIAAERPHGAFTRQLFLGDTLDAERLQTTYDTGVLTLRIPVAEAAKPRKVPVTAGTEERTIEAQTAPVGT
jgi:HSP20 family molecular chaperone IbpA